LEYTKPIMKKLFFMFAAAVALCAFACAQETAQASSTKTPRKVAVQTYTLRKQTLEESIPMLKGIGVDALGCSAGQDISAKYPKVKMGPSMTPEQREFVKKLIADNGFKIVSFGVTGAKDEAGIKAIYEFCKEMNIPVIITEAPADQLPVYEKFGEKYGIKMCLHNHATDNKKNKYYDPNVVWNLVKDYKFIGACPDVGHWSRSGIKPIDGYKIVYTKMDVIHFKDQKTFGSIKNENTVIGKGALNMAEVLKYLDSVGYSGYYVIENESIADDPMPTLKESVEFLRTH